MNTFNYVGTLIHSLNWR